jgi:hypothetical protein
MDSPITLREHDVRAILDGRKTQHRTVLRNPEYFGCPTGDCPHEKQIECDAYMAGLSSKDIGAAVGDRLWVREAWRTWGWLQDEWSPSQLSGVQTILYQSDSDWSLNQTTGKRRQANHMPRWASRITLIVTDVRVQRLQDISEKDAIAEGASWHDGRIIGHRGWRHDLSDVHANARSSFARYWNVTHGPGAWDRNDWVVARTFEVHKINIDEVKHDQE